MLLKDINFIKKQKEKIGLAPGSLFYIGSGRHEKVKYSRTSYNGNDLELIEKLDISLKAIDDNIVQGKINWINIEGVHDAELINIIGKKYNIHSLMLEDILNTTLRPKIEVVESNILVVLKHLYFDNISGNILSDQISLLLGENYVISFQENENDLFDSVKKRISNQGSIIRQMSADYLFYALIDIIVDNYYIILEHLSDKVEPMEDEIIKNPDNRLAKKINNLKKETLLIKKSIWPVRELVNTILREETSFINKKTIIYFRDVYDHIIQIIDHIETYRDIISGLSEIYMTSISNNMNSIMKVLTLISTIFIPLSFIAGVYGMNFKYMPELDFKYGYYGVLTVMILLGVSMLIYYKIKKWF